MAAARCGGIRLLVLVLGATYHGGPVVAENSAPPLVAIRADAGMVTLPRSAARATSLVAVPATAAPGSDPLPPRRAVAGAPPLVPLVATPAGVPGGMDQPLRTPAVASGPRLPAPGLAAISYAPAPVAIRSLPIEAPVQTALRGPVPTSPTNPTIHTPSPIPVQPSPVLQPSVPAVAASAVPGPALPAATNVVPLPSADDPAANAAVAVTPAAPTAAALSPAASLGMQPPLPVPPPPAIPSGVPAPPAVSDVAAAAPAELPRPPAPPAVPAAEPAAAGRLAPGRKPTDAVLVGSFNIQVFGESKIAKPQVVDVLARVVRGLDVVAIQEVRAKSDDVIPHFLSAINADGSRYQFVIGPRLGRTVSKEQYCFIYDSTRIELDPSSVGTVPNPRDLLHRAPLHARFRVRTSPPEAGFSFWLVDIHTDPDEVPQEVDALADVFVAMKSLRPDEDDVILLGDLNAGPPQFGRIKQIPGIGWAVSGVTTNTRRTKTYDNLIFDRTATTEYTGRWGVLDLQDTFGLPLAKALEVSDHNPVWAAFAPWEARAAAATASAPALTVGR